MSSSPEDQEHKKRLRTTTGFKRYLKRTRAVVNDAFPVFPARNTPRVLIVPDNNFDFSPFHIAPAENRESLAQSLAALSELVCRIDIGKAENGGRKDHIGTGILAAPDVVLTCRHVVAHIAEHSGGRWILDGGNVEVTACFDEAPADASRRFRVIEVLYAGTSDSRDIAFDVNETEVALIRLEAAAGAEFQRLAELSSTVVDWSRTIALEHGERRAAAVISYPGNPFQKRNGKERFRDIRISRNGKERFRDIRISDNLISFVKGQFEPDGQPLYGTACVSIGQIEYQLFPEDSHWLFRSHDCSTVPASSGGAVVDISSGKIVGIHCGGIYKKANLFEFFSSALENANSGQEFRQVLGQTGILANG